MLQDCLDRLDVLRAGDELDEVSDLGEDVQAWLCAHGAEAKGGGCRAQCGDDLAVGDDSSGSNRELRSRHGLPSCDLANGAQGRWWR